MCMKNDHSDRMETNVVFEFMSWFATALESVIETIRAEKERFKRTTEEIIAQYFVPVK